MVCATPFREGLPPDRLRSIADAFHRQAFSVRLETTHFKWDTASVLQRTAGAPFHGTDDIEQLISAIFDCDAPDLVGSDPFLADKALLDDILICVKITTAFDRVNAHHLVAMRQAIAFIEDFAAGKVTDDTGEGIVRSFAARFASRASL